MNRQAIRLESGIEPVPGYRLVRILGQGGCGSVWLAEGPGGVQRALKFLPTEERTPDQELQSLELLEDISHPHLIGIVGFWQLPGYLVVGMELADEGSLWDRFVEVTESGQAGIPGPELLGYFYQAALAIDFLESRSLQHGDIKPQNLLLTSAGLKVSDFGQVRLLEHTLGLHAGSGGTCAYSPPEFLEGRPAKQSDQYSLAATWCHLRGGRLPFTGTPAQVIIGHRQQEPDLTMLPAEERPSRSPSAREEARRTAGRPAERLSMLCGWSSMETLGVSPLDSWSLPIEPSSIVDTTPDREKADTWSIPFDASGPTPAGAKPGKTPLQLPEPAEQPSLPQTGQQEKLERLHRLLEKHFEGLRKDDLDFLRDFLEAGAPSERIESELFDWLNREANQLKPGSPPFIVDPRSGQVRVKWTWPSFDLIGKCWLAVHEKKLQRPEEVGDRITWFDPDSHRGHQRSGGVPIAPLMPAGARSVWVTVWPVIDIGWLSVVGNPLHLGPIGSASEMPGSPSSEEGKESPPHPQPGKAPPEAEGEGSRNSYSPSPLRGGGEEEGFFLSPSVVEPAPVEPEEPIAPAAWAPPAQRLPGPHAHVRLLRLRAQVLGRTVWSASSERWPDQLAIVEFLHDVPPTLPAAQPLGPGRSFLDLSDWSSAGWPAHALVTVLPASLPGVPPRFHLVGFLGQGGMGQVWSAESPYYPDLPLAIKFFTHPAYQQHPELQEQCLQEARVGIRIESPWVARTYELLDLRQEQADGWPPLGLVMPLYESSLAQVIADAGVASQPAVGQAGRGNRPAPVPGWKLCTGCSSSTAT